MLKILNAVQNPKTHNWQFLICWDVRNEGKTAEPSWQSSDQVYKAEPGRLYEYLRVKESLSIFKDIASKK